VTREVRLAVVVVSLVAAACGGMAAPNAPIDAGSADAAAVADAAGYVGKACRRNSRDCDSTEVLQCSYLIAEGCGATGVCEPAIGCQQADPPAPVCDCDGIFTSICGLPDGYAFDPVGPQVDAAICISPSP